MAKKKKDGRDNLIPYKKGQSGNPKGRPKKWVSTLTDSGYKMSEVRDCILAMMAMNMEELKDAFDNPNATALEKTVAGAIRRSISRGSLYSMETLMDRVFGKPKETVDSAIEFKDTTHTTTWGV